MLRASIPQKADATTLRPDIEDTTPMEFLIPIVAIICVFGFVPAIIWILAKARGRREVQATLRSAIEKGIPMSPESIDALTRTSSVAPSALSDLRTGVVWLAAGIGIAGMGFWVGFAHEEVFNPAVGLAIIPSIIGAAYIALSFFNPNKDKR